MLFVPLGLVIILMRQLRDPENGARLNDLFAEERIAISGSTELEQTEAVAPDSGPIEGAPDSSTTSVVDLNTQVDRSELGAIKDNTYFRNAEQNAWFHLLAIMKKANMQSLLSSPAKAVEYMQLVEQPQVYRGRLVTVKGEVREVTKQTPAKNDLGIETYYRLVIQPESAEWLIFVYCLELPKELGVGTTSGTVSVTGFYFKNLSYPWRDGLGIAPVIVAKSIHNSAMTPGTLEFSAERLPVPVATATETAVAREAAKTSTATSAPSFENVLALAGWDSARLGKLSVGDTLSEQQQLEVLELLHRLRTFDKSSFERWAEEVATPSDRKSPSDLRAGQLIRLKGRVTRVVEKPVSVNEAARLEMQTYYESELKLGNGGGTILLISASVPQAWLEMPHLDQPASAVAVYVRKIPSNSGPPRSLFLASNLAWFPDAAEPPFVSFGESLLGKHGMNVGLLDGITNHQPVRGSEREAFYQMLAVAGEISASQLVQFAEGNLPAFAKSFEQELNSTSVQRQLLAREVLSRAAEGRFSVAPLFNSADSQIGELFVFDGVARRVTRVEVGAGKDGDGDSDVLKRFGVDHYFEIELFTDDSQNRPLVFCVRELPPGFPINGSIEERVRLAGFLFKSWRYHTHLSEPSADSDKLAESKSRPSISPLLIGRAPIRLPENRGARSQSVALIGGSAVLLALLGIWATVWRWGRSDRRFFEQRLAGNFALPIGESLDAMRVPDRDPPISTDTPVSVSDADRDKLE